jgi:glycosyltransferase involved in cell wall biosynthesis
MHKQELLTKVPALSVCVPAYNGATFLPQLIQAIQVQSFTDWELIIVDNVSTDCSVELISQIIEQTQDARIKLFSNKTFVSMCANWNIALSHARGEFMKLICVDDIPLPDCFERQVKALHERKSVSVCSGSRIIINETGKKLFVRNGVGGTGIYNGKDIIHKCIKAATNIIGDPVCTMWRRSATIQLGLFDTSVFYCTDMEYWLRLLSVGDLYYDSKPVGLYRIHKNATTVKIAKSVASDMVHTATIQAQRGSIKLSKYGLFVLCIKATLLSLLRQLCYKILG